MGRARAVGYIRVSTAEQADQFGLSAQEAAIEDYCRDHDLHLVAVERDQGVSGANGLDSRRGLTDALATLTAGRAELLVVARLDRLARDLLLQETVLGRLRAQGAEVRSVSEPDVDSDDPTRVLVRQVLGAIGQYERALIRARTLAGKAAKKAAGGYGGGKPRYGTRAEGGELVEDADEAAVVERVRQLRAIGRSYREVCNALTAEGFATRRGGAWQPAVVRRIALRE